MPNAATIAANDPAFVRGLYEQLTEALRTNTTLHTDGLRSAIRERYGRGPSTRTPTGFTRHAHVLGYIVHGSPSQKQTIHLPLTSPIYGPVPDTNSFGWIEVSLSVPVTEAE